MELMQNDGNRFDVFFTRDALLINQARQRHLAALGLDLAGKRVLEVGAGIGLHTQFFEALGCSVVTTDARPENVDEIRRRHPHRQADVLDLDNAADLSHFGTFDIIYCYGTLYHLAKPEEAIRAMAEICREMILLETCVSPGDDVALNPLAEPIDNPNQAFSGTGCRPSRPWVMKMLSHYFGHAYLAKYQPAHPDFDLDWDHPPDKLLHRSVFVGSKTPLTNDKLSSELLPQQSHDPDLGQPVWVDVGAHLGETTWQMAQETPWLTVYAFEPNPELVAQRFGSLPNYVTIPSAISTYDGFSNFYLNAQSATSSLLPFNMERLNQWIGGEQLQIQQVTVVPTMRLDTFLTRLGIEYVDYLKIDAQGGDFDVVLSLGDRLHSVGIIKLEVAITPTQLYQGAQGKAEVVDYLEQRGFELVLTEQQSFGQEENLTFVQQYGHKTLPPPTLPGIPQQIWSLDREALVTLAEAIATYRPLQPYPGWYFDIEWGSAEGLIPFRRLIWEYFRSRQQEQPITVRWYNDLQMVLYLGNDISKQLFVAGSYEPNEFYFLSQILQPGMTVIDVGANDGLYALFAASYVGKEGTVLAIEPSSREFDRLQANLNLNHMMAHVKALPIALSNLDGTATLQVANGEHAGQNTLGQFIYEGVSCVETERVAVKRLDDLIVELGITQVDVIKLDTEGAEGAILQGAEATLQTFHPLIILELTDQALRLQGSSTQDVLEFLESLGYEIFSFGQFTSLPIKAIAGSALSSNIIAAHPDRTWNSLTELDQIKHLQTELQHTQASYEKSRQVALSAQNDLRHTQAQLQQTQDQVQSHQNQLQQVQNDLQQTQANLQNTQQQLQQTQDELQQTQANLQSTQQQLQQTQDDLQHTQSALQDTRSKLQQVKEQLKQSREQLKKAQDETEHLQGKMTAMETSKFWKLRQSWFGVKRTLRLPVDDI